MTIPSNCGFFLIKFYHSRQFHTYPNHPVAFVPLLPSQYSIVQFPPATAFLFNIQSSSIHHRKPFSINSRSHQRTQETAANATHFCSRFIGLKRFSLFGVEEEENPGGER